MFLVRYGGRGWSNTDGRMVNRQRKLTFHHGEVGRKASEGVWGVTMQSVQGLALTLSLYCEKLPQVVANQKVCLFFMSWWRTKFMATPPMERGRNSSALEEVTEW